MDINIPGVGTFSIDIPNPVDYANELMQKVKNALNTVMSAIGNFFTGVMSQIGTQLKNILTTIPNTVINFVKDGLGRLWAGLTGRR